MFHLLIHKNISEKQWDLFRTIRNMTGSIVLLLVVKGSVLLAQVDSSGISERTFQLKEVHVIGQRSPAPFSKVSRNVILIRREDIEKAGVQSVQDLLEYVAGTDIRQRGIAGIQADASIRGGSFDHVMVMVNGINLSDPQTGHLSLDLPVDPEVVEYIEILQGPAARILGPGAFTGAINIVTKLERQNSLSVSQLVGRYGLIRTQVNASLKTGQLSNSLCFSRASSEGYLHNTDFQLYNSYYRGKLTKDLTSIEIQTGYQQKSFGAAGFYTPRFPDQFEKAGMWFGSLKISTGNKLKVIPLFYWRRRKDHFLLERDDPTFYQNFHRTDVYGSQVNMTFSTGRVTTSLGFDLRSENIISNNIGFTNPAPVKVRGEDSAYYDKMYGRTNFSYFQEHILELGYLRIAGGIMVNWNTSYPSRAEVFPGIDISYSLLPDLRIYSSANRALHLPTFTDLFYKDPANQGNVNLLPNRTVSLEIGMRYSDISSTGSLSIFYNMGHDIIDWIWLYAMNRFGVVNLTDYKAKGVELNIGYFPSETQFMNRIVRTITMDLLFQHISKSSPDSVSKNYSLKNKFSMFIRHRIFKNIDATWRVSYQDRYGELITYNIVENEYIPLNYKPYWLVDGHLEWQHTMVCIFVDVSNILNTEYVDAGSLLQPGRWFKAGIRVSLVSRK
jgi:iron complex outermembrane receptor protein